MGWQKLREKSTSFYSATVKEAFQLLTISLLGLLLPLSFLLLARLSCAHFPFNLTSSAILQTSSSIILSFSNYTNPTLYVLVSIISFATFIYCLTGKISFLSDSSSISPLFQGRLYLAWIFLCILQLCVGLGIEGSVSAGLNGFSIGIKRSLFSRVIFFLGLHETMLHWCRMVVKPVADETIFGITREETWTERIAMAMSFGYIWWWRLRDEVELLVIVPDIKKQLSMGLGAVDLVGWWLYYLTVTIGMVRIVKGVMWIVILFLCRRRESNYSVEMEVSDSGAEDKV